MNEIKTSLTLLDALRQQDSLAWNRFVHLYSPLMRFWIRRSGIPANESDDLLQELLMTVSGKIEAFDYVAEQRSSLRAWIWGILRNKLHEHWRQQDRHVASPGGSAALATLMQLPAVPFEDSDPALKSQVQGDLVRRAIEIIRSDFQPQTWQAFEQTVMHGRPSIDVAAEMGLSTAAIRQGRFRVLRRLRDELGDDFPERVPQG
ncbi:MAG: RNA polymerase sigma factor [Planctomycetota bacterium]